MIVIGGTLTTYSVLDPERSYLHDAWLRNAEAIKETHPDVHYHTSIQLDGRGLDPFTPLLKRLDEVGGTYWTYTLDDGRTKVTGENRGRHLCAGLNLTGEYATAVGATHWLRLEADTEAPVDVLPRLLEVKNGLAAAACSTYFTYEDTQHWFLSHRHSFPVVSGPMTAACLLIERGLFTRLKWRWDLDRGATDDPTYSLDAMHLFQVATLTRLDCVALHHPASIGPVDTRYPGLDMSVVPTRSN